MTTDSTTGPTVDPGPLGSLASSVLGAAWESSEPLRVAELTGLALRNNPKRAQLIVSRVLAKHVPALPSRVLAACADLADAARVASGTDDVLVMGFCETATGLGHGVAEHLGAPVVATTRRPGHDVVIGFEEPHSHATSHVLAPSEPSLLTSAEVVVLVDDELSTGTTVLNTIEAFETLRHRDRYVVATLTDVRTTEAREVFAARARELGVEVEVVALLSATLHVASDALARVASAVPGLVKTAPTPSGTATTGVSVTSWRGALAPGDGLLDWDLHREEVSRLSAQVEGLLSGDRVLVVGDEELIGLPVDLASVLENRGFDVRVQSTTRSPVHALDHPGYAIRRTLTFPALSEPSRASFLHNVTDPLSGGDEVPYDHVLVLSDSHVEPTHPLLTQLSHFATTSVLALTLQETK
jgi:adenine/guanine phosphoribosyltransferase-like PRPP-binding protein